jgi:hypothetical protein
MERSKGFIITACGIVLKAILSVLLSIIGNTGTSDSVTKVINFIMIVCLFFGILSTINAYKGDSVIKGLVIQAIIITVGFMLSKFIVWTIIIGIFAIVILVFSGGSVLSGINIPDSDTPQMSQVNATAKENEERRQKMKEEIHRTTGIPLSEIHVNSTGTKYYVGDGGDWNKLDREGSAYQDSDGNWHNFS